MNNPSDIREFITSLTPNRQLLANNLLDKKWFTNTDFLVQQQILSLPNDCEGFVFDLSNRPDKIGNLEVVKLEKILTGNYLITPVFAVFSPDTNKISTYEYVSWKTGPHSGVKITVFIETGGKVQYFVTIETIKFAPARLHFDSVGGLIQYGGDRLINLPKVVETAIKNQLGLKSLRIKKFFDLGKLSPDNGLTNNHPSICAVVIDGTYAKKISQLHSKYIKTKLQDLKIQIIPIEQLDSYISKSEDAFFLATIARLLAKKAISL